MCALVASIAIGLALTACDPIANKDAKIFINVKNSKIESVLTCENLEVRDVLVEFRAPGEDWHTILSATGPVPVSGFSIGTMISGMVVTHYRSTQVIAGDEVMVSLGHTNYTVARYVLPKGLSKADWLGADGKTVSNPCVSDPDPVRSSGG